MPMLLSPPRPGYSGHLYWRIATVGFTGDVLTIGGIELAESVGGADIATTASAVTTKTAAGGGASIAALTDGNSSTYYMPSTGAIKGEWVKFQFAAKKKLREVRMFPRTSFAHQTPTVFFVAGSDDNSTWTTYALCIASTWVSGSSQSFTIPTTPLSTGKANARVWGISITDIISRANGYSALAELIFASSIGGSTLCTGGKAAAWKNYDTTLEDCSKAFDGNAATDWASAWGLSTPTWLCYAWATPPTTPVQARIQALVTNFNLQSPKAFDIQWTDDGITYTTTDSYSGLSWTSNEIKSFTIS